MADSAVSLAEKLATRSERELEALGEGMTSTEASTTTQTPSTESTTRPKPREKAGMGRNLLDETTKAILRQMDARIEAFRAAGNLAKVAELEATRKRVIEEAQAASADAAK